MFHRFLSLFLAGFFVCACLRAQTIHRISFQMEQNAPASDALFVLYDNGTGFARVNTPGTGRSEIRLMERYASKPNGEPDTSMLVYDALDARFTADSTAAPALQFWFTRSGNSDQFSPFAVTASGYNEPMVASNITADSLINPTLLTPAFVKNYFTVKEEFYISRFARGSRGGVTAEEQKTKLFMIVVASTHDETIGVAAGYDAQKAIQVFDTVSRALGISKNFILDTVYGDHYSKANVLAAISRLKPSSQDIVVFYYTGHGFTDTAKPNLKYPFMDMRDPRVRPRTDPVASALNIETIYESIKAKGARFNLVISDCCNDKMDAMNRMLPPPPRPGRPRGDTTISTDNLRALFLNKKPFSLLMTSASKYERATSNNRFGSFFTHNFIQTLRTKFYPQNEVVNWFSIMAVSQKLTSFQASNTTCPEPGNPKNVCHQTPFPKIN